MMAYENRLSPHAVGPLDFFAPKVQWPSPGMSVQDQWAVPTPAAGPDQRPIFTRINLGR